LPAKKPAMRNYRLYCAFAVALLGAVSTVSAQLPTTQLTSVFPSGGKHGTTVEVTIAGTDTDDVEKLVFNHAGLKATPKMTAATALEPAKPIANQFAVMIAADVPPGVYEVRAHGRFGLSNPRSFAVGMLNEVTDSAGNSTAEKAIDLPIGTT